jgi:hypothetical protein
VEHLLNLKSFIVPTVGNNYISMIFRILKFKNKTFQISYYENKNVKSIIAIYSSEKSIILAHFQISFNPPWIIVFHGRCYHTHIPAFSIDFYDEH